MANGEPFKPNQCINKKFNPDEPMLSVPEKIVTFKDPMALKTVVDRMKGFDKFLTVTAFPTERLQLTVGTGIVDVTTQFVK